MCMPLKKNKKKTNLKNVCPANLMKHFKGLINRFATLHAKYGCLLHKFVSHCKNC
uniref:Uncharacterized protein n=1 Tax=Octopus bimaculoides TaxID=37653 RepID=A0A0L8HAW1_OCTBM